MKGNIRAYRSFLRRKYEPIAVDEVCRVDSRSRAAGVTDSLERSVGTVHLTGGSTHLRVKRGKNKAPGSDGIGLEFYKANWASIQGYIGAMINEMFTKRNVSAQQKHGVIVCLPKSCDPTTLEVFRPITLLNTNYKIMARIIAYRLRPMMKKLLILANVAGCREGPSLWRWRPCVRLLHRQR